MMNIRHLLRFAAMNSASLLGGADNVRDRRRAPRLTGVSGDHPIHAALAVHRALMAGARYAPAPARVRARAARSR